MPVKRCRLNGRTIGSLDDLYDQLSIRLGLGPDFYNFAGLACGALAGLAVAAGSLELGGWALALSGRVPTVVAAWAPDAIFLATGLAAVRKIG